MNNIKKDTNLDRMAATHAQAIVGHNQKKAKNVDNMATKALGVLQENGIYASALFLKSRKGDEKEVAEWIMEEMLKLLEDLSSILNFGWTKRPKVEKSEDVLKYVNLVVAEKIERLLLAKESLEQMLIYVRYGAKARAAEPVEEASK